MTKSVAKYLDNWRFWWTALSFLLVCVIMWVVYISRNQAHDEAQRDLATRAGNSAQVAQCFAGVKNAPIVAGFIDASYVQTNSLLEVIVNSIKATQQALVTTPKSDKLHQIRKDSLSRLKVIKAQLIAAKSKGLNGLRELIVGTTPTIAGCKKLANSLRVPYKQYLHNLKVTQKSSG